MRLFDLVRWEDPTGVSGAGIVAEGVVFSDGKVALRWLVGEYRSVSFWESIDAVLEIHGHDGASEVAWYG